MKINRRQLRRLIERQIVDLSPEQKARIETEREANNPRVYTPDEYRQARRLASHLIEKFKVSGQFPESPGDHGVSILDLPQQRMHSPQAIETVMTMDTNSLIDLYLGPTMMKNITASNVSYVLYDIVGMDVAEVLRSNAGQSNSMSTMINETLDATAARLNITPAIQNFFEKNMARIDSVTPGLGHVTQNSLAVAAVKLQEMGIDEEKIIQLLEDKLNRMASYDNTQHPEPSPEFKPVPYNPRATSHNHQREESVLDKYRRRLKNRGF